MSGRFYINVTLYKYNYIHVNFIIYRICEIYSYTVLNFLILYDTII